MQKSRSNESLVVILAFQSIDLAIFLDSSRMLLSGQSPYTISQFVYPVSMAAVLAPLSVLPLPLVFRAMILASVSIYAFVILRAARSWPIALLAILSPLFLYNFFYANLDWLVFAALLVNPIAAFLLALLKPQTGIGIALIALIVIYRRNRLLAVLLLIAEIAIFAASFALGMHWSIALNHPGNTSIFPFGLIIGIPMMLLAIRRRDWLMALAATPLCSPYVGPQSWIVILPFTVRLIHQAFARYRLRTGPKAPEVASPT